MRQSGIYLGEIYAEVSGGRFSRPTGKLFRVIQKGVRDSLYSSRMDAVIGEVLDEDENPILNPSDPWYVERGLAGKPKTERVKASRLVPYDDEIKDEFAERKRKRESHASLKENVLVTLREAFQIEEEQGGIGIRTLWDEELDTAVVKTITFEGEAVNHLLGYAREEK